MLKFREVLFIKLLNIMEYINLYYFNYCRVNISIEFILGILWLFLFYGGFIVWIFEWDFMFIKLYRIFEGGGFFYDILI